MTKSPWPSPLYLHIESDQILEVGTAWNEASQISNVVYNLAEITSLLVNLLLG